MRVICVKWGDRYGEEWVFNLKRMVERNLTLDHEFVCLTDREIRGIKCLPTRPGLPGWWSKIGLFHPDSEYPGLNLYLDLDVVITNTINRIVAEALPGKITMRDDFSYSLKFPKPGIGGEAKRLLGGIGTLQSSIMMWHGDQARRIWDEWDPAKMEEVHGDQNYITQVMYPDHAQFLPEEWACSYKYHIMRGEPAKPIVVFHGEPKITQLSRTDPLRLAWEA